MTAPSVVGVATGFGADMTQAVGVPPGSPGDLLLVDAGHIGTAISPVEDGWTLVKTPIVGSASLVHAWWTRTATADEPSEYTFRPAEFGTSNRHAIAIIRVAGAGPVEAITTAVSTGNATSAAAPAATSGGPDRLVLRSWQSSNGNNVATMSGPGTEVAKFGTNAGAGPRKLITSQTYGAGAVPAATATWSSTGGWTAATIVIPPGGGAPDPGVTGSGTVPLPALGVSGTATVRVTGSGNAGLAALGASGNASVRVSGSGSAVLPSMSAAGVATLTVAGSGAAQLPAVQSSGTGTVGTEPVSGAGTVALPAMQVPGTAVVTVAATGTATLPAIGSAGVGTFTAVASGTAALPPLEVTGSGTLAVSGSGVAQLPGLVVTGRGEVEREGPAVFIDHVGQPSLAWHAAPPAVAWRVGPPELAWHIPAPSTRPEA